MGRVRKCQAYVTEWCGLCYANIKGRSNFKGHRGYRPPLARKFEGIEMALRKRDRASYETEGGEEVAPDALAKKLPSLWEFLTVAKYEDGSKRVLGTLIVFCDAGMVKGFVNDRDAGLSACVTSTGLLALLEAVNDGLEGDTLDWRSSDRSKKKR